MPTKEPTFVSHDREEKEEALHFDSKELETKHAEIVSKALESIEKTDDFLTNFLKNNWESFQVVYFTREHLRPFIDNESYHINIKEFSETFNQDLNNLVYGIFGDQRINWWRK